MGPMKIVLTFSLIVLLASAATTTSSSSAAASISIASSSSKAASSSSIATGLALGSDCKTQNVVGADPCEAINKDWCCYYTSSQIGDGAKYEAYTCITNPSLFSSLLDSASSLVSKATTDSSSEAKVEAYCANALFMRLSAALFAFASLSLFF